MTPQHAMERGPLSKKQQLSFAGIYFTLYHYYHIHGRIYLNLSRSIQSAAGLKDVTPAANGRYLMRN